MNKLIQLHFSLLLVLCALIAPSIAFAQSITVQGRIQSSSGSPVSGVATQFRVQILTPDPSRCVLYDETRIVDLSQSNGFFSLNLNDGSGTVNAPATYGLERAISNRSGFSINSSYCQSGSGTVVYNPASTDNRKVVIQFRDPGSMSSFEAIPEMDLNPLPYAIEARTTGGYPANSLLRFEDVSGPAAVSSLSPANFTELLALLNGTSTSYMSASGSSPAGARLPSYNGNPSMPAVGSLWFDTSSGSGVLKYRDSSGVQTLGTGGGGSGTITGVTASGALTGGGTSGAVTISLPTTGVTGFGSAVGSATSVPVITYDSYGRLTTVTTAAISGTLPTGTAGQFLKSSGGSTWAGAGILMGDLKNTVGSLPLFGTVNCSASQSMYWDSGADQIRCQNIAVGNSQISDVAWSKLTGVPNLVANGGGTPSLLTDTEANLPTVHVAGRIFFASDTKKIFRDNGTSWDQLGGASNAVVNALNTNSITTGPTASQPTGQVAGRLFINTTTQKIQYDNGTAWIDVASNGGSGFTGSLAGEVSGTQSATQVDSINGISRSTITTNLNAVTNATDSPTASQLVKRDSNGDFAGRKITSGEFIVKGTNYNVTFIADPSATYSLKLPSIAPAANQILQSDASGVLSWVNPFSGAGVNVSAPLTNPSGTISITQASGSSDGYLTSSAFTSFTNKLGKALTSAHIFVGNGSGDAADVAASGNVSLDNTGKFTVTGIRDQAISGGGTNVGQVLRYSATDTWTPQFLTMKDLRSTVTGTQALTSSCPAGKTLYWDSATDSLSCQDISIAASTQISGQLPIANGGTGTSTTSQNFVFAGPSSGTGAPAFRALAAADLPAEAKLWTESLGNISRGTGNVGIATATPGNRSLGGYVTNFASVKFDVAGQALTQGNWVAMPHNYATAIDDMILQFSTNQSARNATIVSGWSVRAQSQAASGNGVNLGFYPGYSSSYGAANDANLDTLASTPTLFLTAGGNVGIGTNAPTVSMDISNRTDAIRLPSGNAAQQPGQSGMAAAANGMIRYNTTTNSLEAYVNGAWTNLATVGGTQSFAGNVSVGGTFTSTGAATFNGGATIAGGALNMSSQSITGVGSNITAGAALGINATGAANGITLNAGTSGAVNSGSANGTSLSVLSPPASSVNYVTVRGAAAGASPVIGTAGSDTNIDLTLTPKGTGRTIISSGYLGVGTTNPQARLQVAGASNASGRAEGLQLSQDYRYYIYPQSTTSGAIQNSLVIDANGDVDYREGVGTTNGTGRIVFMTARGSTIGGTGASTEKMRIDYNGNVGIGTTAPVARLHAVGSASTNPVTVDAASAASDSDRALNFNVDGINYGKIMVPTSSSGAMAFWTGPVNAAAERMRITYNGMVGIGTTAANELLEVAASSASNAGRMITSNGAGASRLATLVSSPSTAAPYGRIEAYDYGTPAGLPLVLNTVGGGNVGIGTASPGQKLSVAGVIESTLGGIKFPDGSTQTTAASGAGITGPAFSVTRGGTNLTVPSSTYTKIPWTTTDYDTNNNFDRTTNHRFRPTVAGKYLITLSVGCNNATNNCIASIYKNGSSFAMSQVSVNNTVDQTVNVTRLIDFNGTTDYVEGYVYAIGTTIYGDTFRTYFTGALIAPLGNGSIAGTGTANTVPMWTNSTTQSNSPISINGSNVGIGTTSATSALSIVAASGYGQIDVVGNSTNAEAAIGFRNTGLAKGANASWVMGSNLSGYTGPVNTFSILPLGATGLSISPGGYVGIGTTSPQNPLEIQGASYSLRLRNTTTAAGTFWNVGPENSTNAFVIYNPSGAGMYLTYGGTAWSANSDRRVKKQILPITDALLKIQELNGVTYR